MKTYRVLKPFLDIKSYPHIENEIWVPGCDYEEKHGICRCV